MLFDECDNDININYHSVNRCCVNRIFAYVFRKNKDEPFVRPVFRGIW